jgi:hypothetical protein
MTKSGDVDCQSLEQYSFGGSPDWRASQPGWVLAGKKRATCWAASEGPRTEIGKRIVMLDGSRVPRGHRSRSLPDLTPSEAGPGGGR